jgi:nucleoside-diphosphate-sugar epimerase
VFDQYRGRAQRWGFARRRLPRLLRPTGEDILGERDLLVERFRGSRAVIHLAAIPHPQYPGAGAADFQRVNYDGSVNVFEAAREAGVPTFVFASSAQVYRINDPVRLDQLPVLESNYLPLVEEGQTTYGFLKAAVERYLAGACACSDSIRAVSLRLESPGGRSTHPMNLYASTSVENLTAGFLAALSPPEDLDFDVFNLVDPVIDRAVVDVQEFIRRRWPYVPNFTRGNEALLSTEKAQRVLGYQPVRHGHYLRGCAPLARRRSI